MSKPSVLERQALGTLFNVLTEQNPLGYGNYFWNDFEEWEPIKDAEIPPQKYYSTLKGIPHHAKRVIIQSVLLGWNKHHDIYTLYQGITTLIYLKICETSEYFFLQQIYNFLIYFKDVCGSDEFIEIESHRPNEYTIRFWKDNSWNHTNGTHGIVDFQLEPYGADPLMAIVPWYGLINSQFGREDTFNNEEELKYLMNDLYPIINNEFAKKHCPWINSSWDFDYHNDKFNRGIVIILHSLEYTDNNN